MQRNMELIKLLLQEVEGEEPKPDLSAYSEQAMLYHYQLMEEAGLVFGKLHRGSKGEVVSARIERLTSLGHDFLDASRIPKVWAKFREKALSLGGSLSIPVAVELLKTLLKESLNR